MARYKQISDIDLKNWSEYDDLITDSLWILGKRENNGMHKGDYWGNFVPQIPYQAMRRFTQKGELVIDPFMGSGTTLIEALRLGRYAIGVDLQEMLVEQVCQRLASAPNPHKVQAIALSGDSTSLQTVRAVQAQMVVLGFSHAHLLICHPPYHDVIRFSERAEDLSNAPSLEAFLESLQKAVSLYAPLLAQGRFLVLVIGDKYVKGEWVPLGFYAMERIRQLGFRLKSLCVKDIQENRGKRGQYHLWRYRALKHHFYVFKHEYILFFQKQEG